MKWIFYVIVLVYMCYRAVYGARLEPGVSVDEINYDDIGFLAVGTRKTVNCKATARNQRLEWVDPSGKVVKRLPGSRVFAQEHFVTSPKGGRAPALGLTITDLMVSDSGMYQCKSGDMKKNVPICVIKPSEFVNTSAEWTQDSGRSISMTCHVIGEPEPRIEWYRNGKKLFEDTENSRIKMNPYYKIEGYGSMLTITSLEPDDTGLYTCVSIQETPTLEDCTHINTMNITLLVNHSPLFESGNNTSYVYGENNQVVDLTCAASGWPQPTYRWFKDYSENTLYEYDKKQIKYPEGKNEAILSVTAGPTTFGQRFKCVATNGLGEAETYFSLLKIEKPSRPSDVVLASSTGSLIELNVTWDGDIQFPIDGFNIQYIKNSQIESKRRMNQPKETDWRKANLVRQVINDTRPDEESSGIIVELGDLEEETKYWVRVRATNDAGQGPWSVAVQVETATADELEEVEESEEVPDEEPIVAAEENDGIFYGIFFFGGILVIAFVCMFAMRIV